MRVVVVSAHYPPNHVSGGTLVPQRIARGLRARGHDVRVYAGHLDETREPLESWEETDPEGVPVRWIVTTPWTAWSDPLNSDNPAVTEHFSRWLAEVRPDVVHLHSLQTLGAGLVPAAKAAGARVVVTMHDFWWVSPRQFLVDEDLQPCSLVAGCAECACERHQPWVDRRQAVLRRSLQAADVVLAPSRITARVLAANGVPADRLRVDENGIVSPASAPVARPDDGGPLRLLFTGGADPMKGLDTLLAAAERLPRDGSWTLDAYGTAGRRSTVPGVRVLPPYRPDELPAVLGAHDVLVLPSLMRESHSIVTREALAAGLAVVATDTLGPEEVVEDGVNGVVVPAGDPAELAAALARLAADRATVRRMQAAAPDVVLRTVEDQVDGLDRLCTELVSRPAGPSDDEELRAAELSVLRRVLFVVGIQGAPLRYRVHLAAESLHPHGVETWVRHYRDPELPALADRADAVVLYRVPATVQVADLVAQVRARPRPVPVLFDVDDLIFDPALRGTLVGHDVLDEAAEDLWWRGVARYRTTMELCDAYVGSTAALCDEARSLGLPAFRFPNGAGFALSRLSARELRRPRTPGPLRIGYFSGTDTHDDDWAAIEPAVVEVLRARPEVELWVGGLLRTGPALEPFAGRVRRLPMLPWTQLPARLRDLDVNLAPLVLGNRFNEAKSAIKWLEAALVETPTVASPTQPFREAVEHGRTGFLAESHEDWVTAILALLDDEHLRRRVGSRAQREVLLRWSPFLQGERYLDALRQTADLVRTGPRRVSTWEPVMDDEPLSAAEAYVEPYESMPTDGHVPAAWENRIRAVIRTYRAAGVAGVVTKVRARVKDRWIRR